MAKFKFRIIIEQDEDGIYIVSCPSLQGCYSQGETIAEAIENIKDAISLHIEARKELGEPIDGRWTTVPIHKGKDIAKGTLRKILKDVNITYDEFHSLK